MLGSKRLRSDAKDLMSPMVGISPYLDKEHQYLESLKTSQHFSSTPLELPTITPKSKFAVRRQNIINRKEEEEEVKTKEDDRVRDNKIEEEYDSDIENDENNEGYISSAVFDEKPHINEVYVRDLSPSSKVKRSRSQDQRSTSYLPTDASHKHIVTLNKKLFNRKAFGNSNERKSSPNLKHLLEEASLKELQKKRQSGTSYLFFK